MKKPKHIFMPCNCCADKKEHCIAMMPDNTFCCCYRGAPCHKIDEAEAQP
jgi:hypothetical protein